MWVGIDHGFVFQFLGPSQKTLHCKISFLNQCSIFMKLWFHFKKQLIAQCLDEHVDLDAEVKFNIAVGFISIKSA